MTGKAVAGSSRSRLPPSARRRERNGMPRSESVAGRRSLPVEQLVVTMSEALLLTERPLPARLALSIQGLEYRSLRAPGARAHSTEPTTRKPTLNAKPARSAIAILRGPGRLSPTPRGDGRAPLSPPPSSSPSREGSFRGASSPEPGSGLSRGVPGLSGVWYASARMHEAPRKLPELSTV